MPAGKQKVFPAIFPAVPSKMSANNQPAKRIQSSGLKPPNTTCQAPQTAPLFGSPSCVFGPLIEYFQGSPVELLGLFAVLILCGMGLPIPEDIILLATGMIAQANGRSWFLATFVMYFGVLAGDSLAFSIGRRFGLRVLSAHWVRRWITPSKRRRIERLFKHYGSTVFFVARFLPGLRAAIFCTAGAMRVRYLHFLFFDGVAALLSVPFFVWLGHLLWAKFSSNFGELQHAISRTHSLAIWFALALAVVAGFCAWRLRRRPTSAA